MKFGIMLLDEIFLHDDEKRLTGWLLKRVERSLIVLVVRTVKDHFPQTLFLFFIVSIN
jgi:hypothetical protein